MTQLIAASLLWSVSFALIGKSGIDPDFLAAARLGLAAVLFVPFLFLSRGKAPPAKRGLTLMGIGAIQFGAMYVLVLRSFDYLKAHEVALFTVTTPILVVLFSACLERRTIYRAWVAALVAVAAALAIRGDRFELLGDGDAAFWKGFALVQGANAFFALGQVLYRRYEKNTKRPTETFALLYAGGFLVAAAWAAGVADASALELTGKQVGAILYLGLIPSGVAFYLWNRGATRVSVGALAVMNNLKIPLAVAVALMPPFSEEADLGKLALSGALFLVALGIALSARNTHGPTSARQQREPQP